MELTYILIAALIIIFPIILTKLLSRRSREDARIVLGASAGLGKKRQESTTIDPKSQEVQLLLTQGKKTEAIKLMTEKSGMPLESAKKVVEMLENFGALGRTELSFTRNTVTLSQQDTRELQRLINQGKKIEAIKLIRERTGLGLKEAKEIVDKLG